MPDKQNDEVLKLVKEMKDEISQAAERKESETQELKDKLEKMGKDLVETQRIVNEFQHTSTATVEKEVDENGEPVKIEARRKSIFQDEHLRSSPVIGALSKMYYVDDSVKAHMDVRKMLYMPRTDWSTKARSYVLRRSYDGLEDIMDINDMVYMAGLAISHQKKQNYFDVVKGLDSFKLLNTVIQNDSELSKALDTSQNSEFVPTQFSARLLDDVRLQLRFAALFQRLALPRSPFTNPVKGARQVAYLVPESTSDTSGKIPTSDPLSRAITFTAIKIAVRCTFSDELAEDSIVPILPWVRGELVQAMADAEEDAVFNGDDSTTHQHSDVTAANDRRKAFKGMLKHSGGSSGNAAVDISTLNTANLRSIRKKMGRFGAQSNNLAWGVSISAYIQMLSLTEVLTVDKFGPQATVVSGELAKFDGAPVIVSEFVRSDLNTSGVYDGATVTDTEVFLVHTPSFIFGDVGAAKAESDRDIETQQTIVVTSRRTSFEQLHTPGSGEETVGLGYSLTA